MAVQEPLREEMAKNGRKVLLAAYNAVLIVILCGIHKSLDWIGKMILPHGWEYGPRLLEGIFYVTFCAIYVSQAWEMVKIFIPGSVEVVAKPKELPDEDAA